MKTRSLKPNMLMETATRSVRLRFLDFGKKMLNVEA